MVLREKILEADQGLGKQSVSGIRVSMNEAPGEGNSPVAGQSGAARL